MGHDVSSHGAAHESKAASLTRGRVRVTQRLWVPVMGAGASVYLGGTIEGTDADAVAV